jgi:hypothetical protein
MPDQVVRGPIKPPRTAPGPEANVIVRNAKVATLQADRPEAQAFAVRGEKIVAVGDDPEIMRLRGDSTCVIDAEGRRVIPGLNDSHLHAIRGALFYNLELRWLNRSGITGILDGGGSDFVPAQYARARPDTRDMIIGLFSRCMGGVSTFAAMTRFPAAFDGVRCLVSPQPITPRHIAQRRLAVIGLGDRLDDFNILLRLRTSIGLERRIPQEWAKNVRVPTFLYQVRGDTLTDPSDVQTMYDNIPTADKKLQWIEGSTARWDGYLEFQRRPEPMLEWFDQHMS